MPEGGAGDGATRAADPGPAGGTFSAPAGAAPAVHGGCEGWANGRDRYASALPCSSAPSSPPAPPNVPAPEAAPFCFSLGGAAFIRASRYAVDAPDEADADVGCASVRRPPASAGAPAAGDGAGDAPVASCRPASRGFSRMREFMACARARSVRSQMRAGCRSSLVSKIQGTGHNAAVSNGTGVWNQSYFTLGATGTPHGSRLAEKCCREAEGAQRTGAVPAR